MNLPKPQKPKPQGDANIDLNFRLMCKDCKISPPNIVEDYKAGDLICGDCGLVFPMRIIDTRSEWRNFSNDGSSGGDDPSRVGAAENPLLDGVVDHLSTSISSKDGYTGQSAALHKAQHKAAATVKGDRDLMQSFRDITNMTETVGLPRVVGDRAKQLYKKVFDVDVAKNKPNAGIVAACIFIACRQEKVPRTFKEIMQLTRVDKRILGKCVKLIVPLVEERLQTASTEDYLARFCSHLDLPVNVRNLAEEVVKNAAELGILAGKSPLSVASAAIFMICQLLSIAKTEREISPVAGVSENTIRNAYRDLWTARHQVVPKTFTPVVPVALLPSPL